MPPIESYSENKHDEIIAKVQKRAQEKGYEDNPDQKGKVFENRVKRYLPAWLHTGKSLLQDGSVIEKSLASTGDHDDYNNHIDAYFEIAHTRLDSRVEKSGFLIDITIDQKEKLQEKIRGARERLFEEGGRRIEEYAVDSQAQADKRWTRKINEYIPIVFAIGEEKVDFLQIANQEVSNIGTAQPQLVKERRQRRLSVNPLGEIFLEEALRQINSYFQELFEEKKNINSNDREKYLDNIAEELLFMKEQIALMLEDFRRSVTEEKEKARKNDAEFEKWYEGGLARLKKGRYFQLLQDKQKMAAFLKIDFPKY